MRFPVIVYELRKFYSSKIIKFYLFAALFICYKVLIETKADIPMRTFTMPEGVITILVSPIVILWILVPFSMYFMTNTFFDFELNNYIKIRSTSKANWFVQKVIALFLKNCILVGILAIISLIISLRIFKFSMSWGTLNQSIIDKLDKDIISAIKSFVFPYQIYYSPVKVIVLSYLLLCFGLTLVGLAMGIISLMLNSSRIGIILGYLYLLFSFKHSFFIGKSVFFVKYLAFDSFLLFENHNFDGSLNHFFTIRTTFILLPIIFVVVFFIGLLINKNNDISQGV